jgi:antirestriction protein ArdC
MSSIYQEVTDRIVAELETGVPPWTKPWSQTPGANVPTNAVTGKPYAGVNVLLLWLTPHNSWPTPRYLTFNQARSVGAHVRKGEHGIRIVKLVDWVPKNAGGDEDDERHVRTLKYYVVFNVAQCDDLPAKITELPPAKPRHADMRDPVIEEFLAATGAKIREAGERAVYIVNADQILMPAFTAFNSSTTFYAGLFHELGHWTGVKHRLNRDQDLAKRFDEPEHRYAAEELIAELTAAFLCAEFAIDAGTEHASYIASWITLLKADPRAIFTCASRAQAALDYLRGLALREPTHEAAESSNEFDAYSRHWWQSRQSACNAWGRALRHAKVRRRPVARESAVTEYCLGSMW